MKANSDKSKQSNKATRRVLAGVLCGASILSLVLSLVMPPISQAIANDAPAVSAKETVMGGGSSTESTDVENTNNGDTEKLNSGETEGDESDPSNGVEQGQPEGKLQAEDGELSDGNAVMPEGGQTKTAFTEIRTADDLKDLANASGVANFKLMNDIDTSETIQLNNSVSNITLDLNGCKIKHTSQDQPLFNITGGATLTIMDSVEVSEQVGDGQPLNDQGQNLTPANYGKEATLSYDNDGIPTYLSYYVTESSPEGTGTTESLVEHGIDIKGEGDNKGKGAIVACGGSEGLKLINIKDGGHFSLESGVLTQQKGCKVRSLVYAESRSTVNMNGGYVCGGFCPNNGAGAGISVDNSTLSISNGVIAGNRAPSGGGVYAKGSAVTVAGGVISGNSTLEYNGFGGGIMAEYGGSVTVSGGYITNNRYAKFCGEDGWGCHGGAGLAAKEGAHVIISGGQITGNYSEEAGGGVYVTDQWRGGSRKDMAWLNITGGIIASNVSYRSEGAGIRVGQKVDAMISGASKDSPVYITNNHCMSRFDWGGGGVFVQGDSNTASNAGRLFVYNSYISANRAGGYGGGVAVCPTGKTLVTNTEGTAIFGNSSAGAEYDNEDHNSNPYNKDDNSGNEDIPHLSGGGSGKNQDKEAYRSKVFRDSGHADFFLAAHDNNKPIAVVTGKMLGGGDARYSGSIELKKAITIPANGAVGVENSIGLTSGVMSGVKAGDEAAINAQNEATTFITGNYSWDHGGGIMSNGDLYLGVPADTYVYPSLKLKATKKLDGRTLGDGEFKFTVYRKDPDTAKAPSWKNNVFDNGGCEFVESAPNNADGNIAFDLSNDLSKQLGDFSKKPLSDTGKITYSYYLVENAGNIPGIDYDHAVYEINVTVKYNKTVLMSVPIKNDSSATKNLNIYNFTIDRVDVTKNPGSSANSPETVPVDPDADGYYSIVNPDGPKTFTNTYTPYTSSGSWTPKATKVVEGGEMKEFTLQLATDSEFKTIVSSKSTTAGGDNPLTLGFDPIEYKLEQLDKLETDPTGRGASKTFTYYVREQQPTTPFTNYKYDKSVYRFDVTMTDQKGGKIEPTEVTYTKITDVDGEDIAEKEQVPVNFDSANPEERGPTFTNTYSTSLPLSGMSGVTLTYLAGAAVLCAAAAWMHIRRKANAKGGERRE